MSKDRLRGGTSAVDRAIDRVTRLIPPELTTRRELRQAVPAVEPRVAGDAREDTTSIVPEHHRMALEITPLFKNGRGQGGETVVVPKPKHGSINDDPSDREKDTDRGLKHELLSQAAIRDGELALGDYKDQGVGVEAYEDPSDAGGKSGSLPSEPVAHGQTLGQAVFHSEDYDDPDALLSDVTGGTVFNAGLIKG